MNTRRLYLLTISFLITLVIVALKFLMHYLGWELIQLGSLHTSVIAGTIFVVGFLLSTTIADYKESEKIPSDVAATVENMAEDATMIHQQHPDFDVEGFRAQLKNILIALKSDVRQQTEGAHKQIHMLHQYFRQMETAGVPANFIVKLKQEQGQLVKSLFRVSYIQRIKFIPSARILCYVMIIIAIGLLLATEIEPFYGGMALTAAISLILIYILLLIRLISTPFHSEGKTQDDVSMFLIDQVVDRIASEK